MGRTRVDVRLPDDLIEKSDAAANVRNESMSEIVTEALRSYLDDIEEEAAIQEDLVELYLDEEISDRAHRAFVGRQDAESVRASKALLDQGDAVATDLADQ